MTSSYGQALESGRPWVRGAWAMNLGFPSLPAADRLPLFMVSSQFLCKREGKCWRLSLIIDGVS